MDDVRSCQVVKKCYQEASQRRERGVVGRHRAGEHGATPAPGCQPADGQQTVLVPAPASPMDRPWAVAGLPAEL